MALAGLALAMLAAASPAAADEADDPAAPADHATPTLFLDDEDESGARARPGVWPIAVELDLGDGVPGLDLPPVGLAVRLSEDTRLGAAGGVDLDGDGAVGIIAFEIDF